MKLTRENIRTRVALAQCCLADLAIEVLEAERLGDESRVKCKAKKAYLLKAAIDQLKCWRPSIPGGAVWSESFSSNAGGGPTASLSVEFMGYTVLPPTGISGAKVRDATVDIINSYSSQDWTVLRCAIDEDLRAHVQYNPAVVDISTSPISVTGANGIIVTSNGDGSLGGEFPASDRLSNASAEKLFGLIDSVCDCPCTKKGSEITDDTLPKYVRTE